MWAVSPPCEFFYEWLTRETEAQEQKQNECPIYAHIHTGPPLSKLN